MVAAIGGNSRANVESTGRMFAPGRTGEWGFVSITELASRVNGMCTKIKWETIEAVMGRDGRVGMPRL